VPAVPLGAFASSHARGRRSAHGKRHGAPASPRLSTACGRSAPKAAAVHSSGPSSATPLALPARACSISARAIAPSRASAVAMSVFAAKSAPSAPETPPAASAAASAPDPIHASATNSPGECARSASNSVASSPLFRSLAAEPSSASFKCGSLCVLGKGAGVTGAGGSVAATFKVSADDPGFVSSTRSFARAARREVSAVEGASRGKEGRGNGV